MSFTEKITKEILLSKLDVNWFKLMPELRDKPYWNDIVFNINKSIDDGYMIVPKLDDIFKAINTLNLANFRVLLIGQDPYPTIGNANGYSFSVNPGVKTPASLLNMFKEIDRTYDSTMVDDNKFNGCLDSWVDNGVFLLNSILTIGILKHSIGGDYEKSRIMSHKNIGWIDFVTDIIRYLDCNYKFVTLALGATAKTMAELVTRNANNVIYAGHPSPMMKRKMSTESRLEVMALLSKVLPQNTWVEVTLKLVAQN